MALLLSAVDAKAVVEAHQAQGTDELLPPGVVKVANGYLAVKQGFVVFAPTADDAAAVLAAQESHQIMPAAKDGRWSDPGPRADQQLDRDLHEQVCQSRRFQENGFR